MNWKSRLALGVVVVLVLALVGVVIATAAGARVLQHAFVNQAEQMSWALNHGDIRTEWVFRLDADEYVTPALAREIVERLPVLDAEVTGILLPRRVMFMGRWIRHGGYYPVRLLRIWRTGKAVVEQRLMDEHTCLVTGRSLTFVHDLVDENLNSLSWWTDKHNQYATREAAEWLNERYGFLPPRSVSMAASPGGQAAVKRWYKRNLYDRMPLLFRAFLYFHYRYILRLGFLDGRQGLIWHFLQGFWYRFLVDAKIIQVLRIARTENMKIEDVLSARMGLRGLQGTSPPITKEAE